MSDQMPPPPAPLGFILNRMTQIKLSVLPDMTRIQIHGPTNPPIENFPAWITGIFEAGLRQLEEGLAFVDPVIKLTKPNEGLDHLESMIQCGYGANSDEIAQEGKMDLDKRMRQLNVNLPDFHELIATFRMFNRFPPWDLEPTLEAIAQRNSNILKAIYAECLTSEDNMEKLDEIADNKNRTRDAYMIASNICDLADFLPEQVTQRKRIFSALLHCLENQKVEILEDGSVSISVADLDSAPYVKEAESLDEMEED